MKHPLLLRGAAACAALSALIPATAAASTWTVDDDRAQCPAAAFTSIQAAVEQAAPWDTVIVCDGLYLERSTPVNHANSPSQAGSQNGLTITKPLTIKGAGAAKVTIRPDPAVGATLAGTAPFLRDGGGNVVTISRQSLGSSDDNENFVDISGVTIESPDVYAEAGIAFFNTSGRISKSRVGPLVRAADAVALAERPHGWGVIQTNSLQGAEAGVRRQVTVADSLITGYQSGGILFDEARGPDGDAANTTRSGMVGYGYVTGARVVGSGSSPLIPQTGVRYHAGARGSVTGSEISGNFFAPDPRQSVGLLLTDAETGADPANSPVRAFVAAGNRITGNGYGAFNADIANAAVRAGAPALVGEDTWWGCQTGPVEGAPSAGAGAAICQGVSGASSLELGTPRAAAHATRAVPPPVTDAPPTGAALTGDFVLAPGQLVDPMVSAADDFAVKRVTLALDGTAIAALDTPPFEFAPTWTPAPDDVGTTFALTAIVTDSAGQQTVIPVGDVTVVGPGYVPLSAGTDRWDAGPVQVGARVEHALTLTNTGVKTLRLLAGELTGDGFDVSGGSCGAGLALAPGAACTLVVTFAPEVAGAASGELLVTSTASAEPVVVALEGNGVPVPDSPGTTPPGTTPPDTRSPGTTPPRETPTPAPLVKRFGRVTATLTRSVVLRSSGLRLGTLACAGNQRCAVRVRGELRVGKARYRIALKRTVAAGKRATLRVKPGPAARRTLAKRGTGTLSLRLSTGGRRASATLRVTG
jgi:hypothetical protein